MPSAVDIANEALGEIGARVIINNFSDNTPAANACRLNYDKCRQMLLRCAPWGFARKSLSLSQLGSAANGTAQFPWMFSYAYPPDCIKFRYTLEIPLNWPFPSNPVSPPVTGDTLAFPYYPVSRRHRFLLSGDQDGAGNARKIILSNLCQPIGVYNYDATDVTQFDVGFWEALVAMLCEKLIMPTTGNVGLKGSFIPIVEKRIIEAKAADGNEGVPTTDINVDWIQVRGFQGDYYYSGIPQYGSGILQSNWDDLAWGS